jgi:formylglycine-generating enzyme
MLLLSSCTAVVKTGGSNNQNPPNVDDSYTKVRNNNSPSIGDITEITVAGTDFNVAYVPSGLDFPTGLDDSGIDTIDKAYQIGVTEVTFELYTAVRKLAIAGDYIIQDVGQNGAAYDSGGIELSAPAEEGHPVSKVNFYSAIVWLNALSDLAKKEPVYYCDESILKSSAAATACGDNVIEADTDGFRLPIVKELIFAARYIGPALPPSIKGTPLESSAIKINDIYFTPGLYASGATDYAAIFPSRDLNPDLEPTREVAVFWDTSASLWGTAIVGSKKANALSLYDISGNVSEWSFDILPDGGGPGITCRRSFGGNSRARAFATVVGLVGGDVPTSAGSGQGFRLARTVPLI